MNIHHAMGDMVVYSCGDYTRCPVGSTGSEYVVLDVWIVACTACGTRAVRALTLSSAKGTFWMLYTACDFDACRCGSYFEKEAVARFEHASFHGIHAYVYVYTCVTGF